MIHKYSEKVEVLNTPQSVGYKLAENKQNEFVKLELKANGVVPEHALPMHVVFYVIAGVGKITINEQDYLATTGDMIEVPANSSRAWENTTNQTLELLVVKQIG